jgi:hypothetical protein
MTAAYGEVVTLRVRIRATFDITNSSPVERRRIPVLLVASDNTAFAADTFRRVEMKTVLLAVFETPRGEQFAAGATQFERVTWV